MSFRGHIRDGAVESDGPINLPNGTPVDIQPVAQESLAQFFRRVAVRDDSLPQDYAAELDHYLYGLPKRGDTQPQRPSTRNRKSSRARKKGSKRA